jgi:hypothetical protein
MTKSSTAAFADASENQRDRLPELPPGKKHGPRIGGWGPYSIVDDVPAVPDPSTVRGSAT